MKRVSLAAAVALLLLSPPALAGWNEAQSALQRRDWPAAVRELKPLADGGHLKAQAQLGFMLLNGQGIEKNEAEGIRLLTAAADKNEPFAQFGLGGAYFQGKGVPSNRDQGLILFLRAADQNQPNALNNLGQIYFQGIGVPKDETKALAYLRRAADLGISASWETIGIAYWHGRGVSPDRSQAVPWLKKAAEHGHMVAQNLYGAALWNGEGIAKNQTEAVRWFERAGNQGDGPSLTNAAIAYRTGTGVARDPEKAYYYFILAERQAKPQDIAKAIEARDKARTEANPDQEKRAQARAATWKPSKDSGDGTAPAQSAAGSAAKEADKTPPRPQLSSGSGFAISHDGIVLTNSHVVKSCRNIRVSIGDDTLPQAAVVIARDEANDLAALKTSLRSTDIARFREDKPLRSGDEVVVVGFPLSTLLSREPNITAGVISAMAGIRGDKRHYQLTAPIQRGNSGGPVVDMSGAVVAVVVATLKVTAEAERSGAIPQNVNFAIKADLARKFLSDNAIAYGTTPSGPPMSAADVGDKVRKVAAFIECEG
jgi:TPR repeat protein